MGLTCMALARCRTSRRDHRPSMARQLYDIQAGTRHGSMTELMKPVVAKLNGEDIIDLTAYLASLPPQSAAAGKSASAR